jgi:branched-chain amino acid aminotransferase
MAARSFELEGSQLRPRGEYPSLLAASAALPQGIYTTLRTYGGRSVIRLDRHLDRLEEGVALQGRPSTVDRPGTRAALAELMRSVAPRDLRLRLTFAPPALYASAEPFEPPPNEARESGVACVTIATGRTNPHAKDTRFIATAGDAYRSLPAGIEEGLMVADDGAILEGLSSNFFAITGGELRTEEHRALMGVTRGLVLDAASGVLPLRRIAVRVDDIPRLAEAFITSVSREVLPVVRVDGLGIGDGRPGPMTRAIERALHALIEREAESIR